MAASYRVVACCDAAYGESARADYTAIAVGGRDLSVEVPRIHLLDVWQDRVSLEAVPGEIARMYGKWHPEYVGIENTLWQASIIRQMRLRGDIPFLEIDRRKQHNPDKRTRAGNLAFHYSERHVFHPRPAPSWMQLVVQGQTYRGDAALEQFEAQLLAFTGIEGRDDHDDLVDAWIDCVDALTLTQQAAATQHTMHAFTFDAAEVDAERTSLFHDLGLTDPNIPAGARS